MESARVRGCAIQAPGSREPGWLADASRRQNGPRKTGAPGLGSGRSSITVRLRGKSCLVTTAGCGDRREKAGSGDELDRKSTRLNSSHANISYAVFCLKKKKIILQFT